MAFYKKLFWIALNSYTITCFTKIFPLDIELVSFISVGILCELFIPSDVYVFTFTSRKKTWIFLPDGIEVHTWQYINKKHQNFFTAIILLCLGYTSKQQDCQIIAWSLVYLVQTFDQVILENETTKKRNWTGISRLGETRLLFNSFSNFDKLNKIGFLRRTIIVT